MDVSIIIPTYNRYPQLRCSLESLRKQKFEGESEIIVVADGCTDRTEKMLRRDFSRVKLVVFKANQGAAVALNTGVRASQGKILLFLDDDMEYQPGLVAAHLEMHSKNNYEVVIGHFPLGKLPTKSFFRRVIYEWTEGWQKSFGQEVSFYDALCSGHFSIKREWYEKVGGFDEQFSKWGRKDSELGYRLLKSGAHFGYSAKAQARQNYDKHPSQFLADYKLLGRADVEMCKKHPELRSSTLLSCFYQAPWMVKLLRELGLKYQTSFPISIESLSEYFDQLHEQGHLSRVTEGLFWILADCYYWQGVREMLGNGFLNYFGQPFRILLYHRIAEDGNKFSVPIAVFQAQMRYLAENDYSVLPLVDVVKSIRAGKNLPPKTVVITFDDGYQDFLRAHEVLKQYNFPATLFVPTAYIGKTNSWDIKSIRSDIPILSSSQIRKLLKQDVSIQSHGHSHKQLGLLSDREQELEIAISTRILKDEFGVAPMLFSYPSGSFNQLSMQLLNKYGYSSGVSCISTPASKDSDIMALPRITVEGGILDDFAMRLHYGIGTDYARSEFLEQITNFRPAKWWHTAPEFDPNRIYVYQTKRPEGRQYG